MLQVVAAHKGKLVSVFDGRTEYEMYKWNLSKAGSDAHPPVWTTLWVFPTLDQVRSTLNFFRLRESS